MTIAALVLYALLLACRLLAAGQLDLFGDEAFYWQCSHRLDWAFADHPFMTACLVRLGTTLFGEGTLAVRSAFVALGATIPWLCYAISVKLVSRQQACEAAALSLLLPALGLAMLLAVPDVPLLVFELAGLAALLRASDPAASAREAWAWWLMTGVFAALGLSTHYRGLLFPAAVGVWLLWSPRQRRQLAAPAPWCALGLTLLGLLPSWVFNLRTGFASWHYQMVERHANGVHDGGALLDHLGEQAAIVTPLMYVALIGCWIVLGRRARRGDERSGLLFAFSGLHLLLFFLASPWTDGSHTSVHWTLPGYVPLFAVLPGLLRGLADTGRWARRGVAVGLALSLAFVLVVAPDVAGLWSVVPRLHRAFAGWSEMTEVARLELCRLDATASAAGTGRPLLVGDDYYLAAHLEHALGSQADVYTLDHPRNFDHGRALQFAIWQRDEQALLAHRGERALLVVEWTGTNRHEREAWRQHLDEVFDGLAQLTSNESPDGGRRFAFYEGRVSLSQARSP